MDGGVVVLAWQCLMHSTSNTPKIYNSTHRVHVMFFFRVKNGIFAKRNLMHTWISPTPAQPNTIAFIATYSLCQRAYGISIFKTMARSACVFSSLSPSLSLSLFIRQDDRATYSCVGFSFNVCSNGGCPHKSKKKKKKSTKLNTGIQPFANSKIQTNHYWMRAKRGSGVRIWKAKTI